jgi:hypothetical protein
MKVDNTTIITAFYPLKSSKHSIGNYKAWIQNLCKIPSSIVIFTTEEYALELHYWRRNLLDMTHVIVRKFDSYAMTCPSMMRFWEQQEKLDPENGKAELYAIWALKQEMVRIVINQNRFQSKWFTWCDIGIQRYSKLEEFYVSFPSDVDRLCVPGRMAFLEVDRISQKILDDWDEAKPTEYPFPEIAIGSGCIVGDADTWQEFGEQYKNMLKEFAIRGWFAGNETKIFFAILMEKKMSKPFRLFHSGTFGDPVIPGIEWLCFPVMLGGNMDAELDMRFEPVD